ncbi:MAG: LPS export ABC transporter permease LptF [Pseudomonadota bacterium]
MKLIDRYVARELASSAFAVTLVLVLIMAVQALSQVLDDVVEDGLPLSTVLSLVGVNIIGLLGIVMSLGIFLGVMIGLGRLTRDGEITAMNACGIGLARLCKPAMLVALVFSVLSAVLSLWLTPWSVRLQHVLTQTVATQSPLAFLQPGTFANIGPDGSTFYSEQVSADGRRISEVFLQTPWREDGWAVEVARFAEYQRDDDSGAEFLVLVDGERLEFDSEGIALTRFDKHGVKLPNSGSRGSTQIIAGLETSALWQSDRPAERSELHWRLAMPLSVLVLTVLAVALSHAKPRQGRYSNVLYGLLMYILYANALVVFRRQMADDKLPEVFAMWWVHLLPIVIALSLFAWRRQIGTRPAALAESRL